MNPLHFEPVLKRIRWGGTRLGTVLGKEIGTSTDVAESWEIVDHGSDQSIVSRGEHSGETLAELVRNYPEELFGESSDSQFPLLIKFLDATDRLSLQVHPNDQQAVTYDPAENGKTEAWIILDTTPESRLWLGMKSGVTRAQVRDALAENRIDDVVHSLVPQPGDCYFVPAGTAHAIGEGILLAEVQQSSDLTFRMHDWGRVGTDGKPRELHLEESLTCLDLDRGPQRAVTPRMISSGDHRRIEELVACPYFRIERHHATEDCTDSSHGKFFILMLLSGNLSYECGGVQETLNRGESILVPASSPDLHLKPSAESTWLRIDCP
jgi:mannose-6-phosphate isomerase